MKWFVFLLIAFPKFFYGEWERLFPVDEDPSLFQHVHVISGQLTLGVQDAVVKGASLFPLMRTYSSSGALDCLEDLDLELKDVRGGWLVQGGWNILPHINLLVTPGSSKEMDVIHLAEPSGHVIAYFYSHTRKGSHGKSLIYYKPEEVNGQCSGSLSAKANPQNNLLCFHEEKREFHLELPNGGVRIYQKPLEEGSSYYGHLSIEKLPSGHQIHYLYDEQYRLIHIDLKNPKGTKTYSWVHFDVKETKTPFLFEVKTSDGKHLRYSALLSKGRDYLHQVLSNCRPAEVLNYSQGRDGIGPRVSNMTWEGNLQFKANYFESLEESRSLDKVRSLEAPLGPLGEMVVIAEFTYKAGVTDVIDSEGVLVRYHHKDGVIREIQYFDEKKEIHSSLKFLWKEGRLKAKVLCDSDGPVFSKVFTYDRKGNVVEEVIWGQLTGLATSPFILNKDGSLTGAESRSKRYVYQSDFNVLTYEEDENLSHSYVYKHGTNLLLTKITSDKNGILIRHLFFYDDDHLLVAEIVDDGKSKDPKSLVGVTERSIKRYEIDPFLGLPVRMDELYFDPVLEKEIALKSCRYTYNQQCLISSEEVCDSHGNYRYTLYTEYDDQSRIKRKTTPLGQVNTYSYDDQGNLIESQNVQGAKKGYVHDAAGRMRSFSQGEKEKTSCNYDTKGRVLSKIDSRENSTSQIYDVFGHCLETTFPETRDENGVAYTPIVKFSYDVQGNLTSHCSPRGEITETVYNVFRHPIKVIQSDSAETRYVYNKNGSLLRTIHADQTEIRYEYDSLQRITSKKVFSAKGDLLAEEHFVYNAFHLLSHIDARGVLKTFTYDGVGRKSGEEVCGRKITYQYDSLGFLERVTKAGTSYVEIHDVSGAVIQKWEEREGSLENLMSLYYTKEDLLERKVRLTPLGESVNYFVYDDLGRMIKQIDPLGATTQFFYEDVVNDLGKKVLKKTTVNSLGQRVVEIMNALNHIVSVERQDKEGKTASFEELFYDHSGNQVRRIFHVYLEGVYLKKIAFSWEYDSLGRVIKEVEEGSKISLFSYDLMGRLTKKVLPSGISIEYSYDGIGRVLEVKSSDGTIHYEYFYEKGQSLVAIVDKIKKTTLKCSRNLFGEIIEEIGSLGLRVQYTYDELGRRSSLILPDRSCVSYEYSKGHLYAVSRKDSEGKLLYQHLYTEFDINGRLTKEQLVNNLGQVETSYDLLERPLTQKSPLFIQNLSYGTSGLIAKAENSLFKDKSYLYDSLDQLKMEGEESLLFDSIGNRFSYKTNDRNQVVLAGEESFGYDLDGNTVERKCGDRTILYGYDALGRLTSIVYPQQRKVEYEYDPLSRLVSKEIYIWSEEKFVKENSRFYLYDGAKEIGTTSADGKLLELRVLGFGIKGDIGAAIAIEIGQEVFVPLHDFYGNVIALVSSDGQIVESYEMNAFGREKNARSSFKNPWRFSSKRHEEGLVFFGARFYDPVLGRWITPDPSGFVDGPNLYAYVLNSPLNRLDLFGLSSLDRDSSSFYLEASISSIEGASEEDSIIECQGSIDGVFVDCYMSCGFLHHLQYTPEEIKVGRVNLLDHFAEILPSEGRTVGLITLGNGMNTTYSEFKEMSRSITNRVGEGTLFIGLHTPTTGFFQDIGRSVLERENYITTEIVQAAQFMGAIVDRLHTINPELIWLDIRHSEGGVIGRRAIEMLTPQQQTVLQRQMYSLTIGSAMPMPNEHALQVCNIYSDADYFTGAFGWVAQMWDYYMENSFYNIEIHSCKSSWEERVMGFADHAFIGSTYQSALDNKISEVRTSCGFYDASYR